MAEAEEAKKYPVRLYDTGGNYVGEVEHDDDLNAATARSGHVMHRGKVYLWDQRTSTWRESAHAHEVKGKMATPEAPAEEAKPEAASSKK